jgi:hypothetical protein
MSRHDGATGTGAFSHTFLPPRHSIVSSALPIIAPGEQPMQSYRVLVWAVIPIVVAVIVMACSADSTSMPGDNPTLTTQGDLRAPGQ